MTRTQREYTRRDVTLYIAVGHTPRRGDPLAVSGAVDERSLTCPTRSLRRLRPEASTLFGGPGSVSIPLTTGGVREAIIARCSSVSFAAGVFSVAPTMRVGGLSFDRTDDAKGNATAVIDFRIQKQPIKWWVAPGLR